jgi:hypothetical protein
MVQKADIAAARSALGPQLTVTEDAPELRVLKNERSLTLPWASRSAGEWRHKSRAAIPCFGSVKGYCSADHS